MFYCEEMVKCYFKVIGDLGWVVFVVWREFLGKEMRVMMLKRG